MAEATPHICKSWPHYYRQLLLLLLLLHAPLKDGWHGQAAPIIVVRQPAVAPPQQVGEHGPATMHYSLLLAASTATVTGLSTSKHPQD
jgi:hypothetical protein